MSNNQQYDTKCLDHPHQDIVLICSTCPNNIPVCIGCISGIHNGHKFKDIKDKNIKDQIQQEFTNQTIPNLNNFLEYNKLILDESNNHFKQIQHNHTKNFDKVFKIFKELKDIINTKENDIKRLLITKLDENKDINNIITTTIEDNINKINKVIKYNNNHFNNNNDNKNDNNINNNDFIELLKNNYQSNNILSKIYNNNLPEYKDTQLIIRDNNIDSIKDLTNSYLEILDDIPFFRKDLKRIKSVDFKFTIYSDGFDISHIKTRNLAIGPIQCFPKTIPTTVTHLSLLDGFNQPLDFIPHTVQALYLHNIKYQLTHGSVPSTVRSLSLHDGFDQPLKFIPPSVYELFLGNIKYQLKPGSIPATVANLILLDGFNQSLNFIPDTVKRLSLHNIKYQLIPGSIPNHLIDLRFENGFSQRFTKGIIPAFTTWMKETYLVQVTRIKFGFGYLQPATFTICHSIT
ncbi:hypothetical protein DICPUDRAFT_157314 [Dictyostelium purpureum]|uniref:B box-type domain-containing protein n=1 Tax=Dictyostelium purpureum TaxID=5786 RepID=F0ZYT5_DICPU|nr:uncharacterized protein DICPUDRAFT_157314 [Dictyostelium purpureum]EGC30906.1 hypothetical protein DICPUDRAFT_157314 [Dictyostelium purpureum]|eukprot:XP_003292579.1 hypothetical protein DICPUDRAFT_157314 [Dictyostelium purpureum]